MNDLHTYYYFGGIDMKYYAGHYVNKQIRLYPSDTYAKYGIITRVDDLGWTIKITRSNCKDFVVGQEYFISHSKNFIFEFMNQEEIKNVTL